MSDYPQEPGAWVDFAGNQHEGEYEFHRMLIQLRVDRLLEG